MLANRRFYAQRVCLLHFRFQGTFENSVINFAAKFCIRKTFLIEARKFYENNQL